MKLLSYMACAIILLVSCGHHKEGKEIKDYNVVGNSIIINNSSPLLDKIKTEAVKTHKYSEEITTAGSIKAIPNKYAEIASPFAGRIVKSFIRLGQHVKKNEPIFEINSPEFFEAGKLYYQAKQELELAHKNLKRQQDLSINGVGIQKDLEEAELNHSNKERDFENAILSLKVFQVNPKNLILGQSLIVRSPIEGEIIKNNLVMGQYIKDDEAPVASVAELSKVWVIGQVKEKDISKVSKDSDVQICLSSIGDQCINAKIYHISDILDEDTRSVEVYIECKNDKRLIKPGMYATVKFIHSPQEKILIPSSSILQLEDNNYVFVQTGTNTYERRNVRTNTTNSNMTIIESGLSKGEIIITVGSYYLMEAK